MQKNQIAVNKKNDSTIENNNKQRNVFCTKSISFKKTENILIERTKNFKNFNKNNKTKKIILVITKGPIQLFTNLQ
jgi:hypothetical protein